MRRLRKPGRVVELMGNRCRRHPFEEAEDLCGHCGLPFCGECLVDAFGPKKPPMCIACAVAVAGIRASAGRTPRPRLSVFKRLIGPPSQTT